MRVDRLLSIQVDCVVFQPPRKKAAMVCKELENMTYEKLHLATRRPLTRFAGPLQDSIKSKEKVYQLKQLDEPLYPGGTLALQEGERPEVEQLEWDVYREPPTGADTFAEAVVQHVLSGKSCCVIGPPGSGKSQGVLGPLRDRLEEAGQHTEVLAPTNAAARIVRGCTVHAFLTRMASSRYGFSGVILIDETSMLSMALVAVLDQLRAGGARIVSFGDWAQLPPVGNSWRGHAIDPLIFKDSALLKRWSDCTLFELTRCRRSDQAHFDFYTSLPECLETCIALARAKYKKSDRAQLHLTISHRKRRSINTKLQQAFAGEQGLLVPAFDGEPEYRAVPGTPLVGSCTGRGFVNGAFYEVGNLGASENAKQSGPSMLKVLDKLTGEVIECTPDVLAKHTCLAHAVVYNRAQGFTTDHTVCLHDFASKYFRRNHLYVGLSRVTNGTSIRIAA
jgi:hypothetical protein